MYETFVSLIVIVFCESDGLDINQNLQNKVGEIRQYIVYSSSV